MPKAQEYFENTFSINRETIEFNGWSKSDKEKLEGSLDLKEFNKLKKLDIQEYLNINSTPFFGTLKVLSDSKLNDLKIKECGKIEGGWEFLPTTLKIIEKDRDNLFGNLRDYQNNFPAWRKDHDFLLSRIRKLEQQLIEQEKITNKVLKGKEQQEKQLASEKQTFLTTAGKLNNYISQLEGKLAPSSNQ